MLSEFPSEGPTMFPNVRSLKLQYEVLTSMAQTSTCELYGTGATAAREFRDEAVTWPMIEPSFIVALHDRMCCKKRLAPN